jgi:hypothetical protein
VRIVQREISLIVSPEGQHVLGVSAGLPPSGSYSFVVDETDDLGLWVRISRQQGEHRLLIRWEYVLSIDVEVAEKKELGFQH